MARLAQRTPISRTLRPGPHTVAVSQNGVEVWQQSITAEAAARTNSIRRSPRTSCASAQDARPHRQCPRRPRLRRRTQRRSSRCRHQPVINKISRRDGSSPVVDRPPPFPTPRGSAASAPDAGAAITSQPPVPAITPTAPTAQKPTPMPKGPLIVPPSAVTKLSGEPPSIERFRNVERRRRAAKVCIDETGKVTSADMATKVERRVAADLTDTLRKWRYSPYLYKGTAISACFVVPFRLKQRTTDVEVVRRNGEHATFAIRDLSRDGARLVGPLRLLLASASSCASMPRRRSRSPRSRITTSSIRSRTSRSAMSPLTCSHRSSARSSIYSRACVPKRHQRR